MPDENNNLPSVESVNQLFGNLNSTMETFMQSNPGVPTNLIFIAAIRAMLVFPLDWMRNAGTREHYVDMMEDHIKAVYATYVINDETNKTDD